MIRLFFTIVGCVSIVGLIVTVFEIILQIFENFFKKK